MSFVRFAALHALVIAAFLTIVSAQSVDIHAGAWIANAAFAIVAVLAVKACDESMGRARGSRLSKLERDVVEAAVAADLAYRAHDGCPLEHAERHMAEMSEAFFRLDTATETLRRARERKETRQ